MYQLGIFTSLFDDEAPRLLKTIDDAIDSGVVEAEVPFVFCNKKEGVNSGVDARIAQVRKLKHLKRLIFVPPEEVDAEAYARARSEWGELGEDSALMRGWRERYDTEIAGGLPATDSDLNIGYMLWMTPVLHDRRTIVNLHPALPGMGPIGMWPKVMREQALRPLSYLAGLDEERVKAYLPHVMRISRNKAGAMLHMVTKEPDRGPVISWYEFDLVSLELQNSWLEVAKEAKGKGLEGVVDTECFNKLTRAIRVEQVQGEHPLLLLTYHRLTREDWKLKERSLHISGTKMEGGYCLNKEIGECLRAEGIRSEIA